VRMEWKYVRIVTVQVDASVSAEALLVAIVHFAAR